MVAERQSGGSIFSVHRWTASRGCCAFEIEVGRAGAETESGSFARRDGES